MIQVYSYRHQALAGVRLPHEFGSVPVILFTLTSRESNCSMRKFKAAHGGVKSVVSNDSIDAAN